MRLDHIIQKPAKADLPFHLSLLVILLALQPLEYPKHGALIAGLYVVAPYLGADKTKSREFLKRRYQDNRD